MPIRYMTLPVRPLLLSEEKHQGQARKTIRFGCPAHFMTGKILAELLSAARPTTACANYKLLITEASWYGK